MAASLLFTTPIDAPGGTTERKLPLHGPRPGPPGKFPKEFPASGREFLGPKFARPPAGQKTRRPSAGADWPGENLPENVFSLRENDFCKKCNFGAPDHRNRPRDPHFRNLRVKLYGVPKFSSKTVP